MWAVGAGSAPGAARPGTAWQEREAGASVLQWEASVQRGRNRFTGSAAPHSTKVAHPLSSVITARPPEKPNAIRRGTRPQLSIVRAIVLELASITWISPGPVLVMTPTYTVDPSGDMARPKGPPILVVAPEGMDASTTLLTRSSTLIAPEPASSARNSSFPSGESARPWGSPPTMSRRATVWDAMSISEMVPVVNELA